MEERYTNSEGYDFIVVNRDSKGVWVEFQDEHKARVHTSFTKGCKCGQVKNPYHKSVHGIGCLGLLSDGTKPKAFIKGKQVREYRLWVAMIRRCYVNNKNAYKNVTVCERWLVYANFLEDLPLIEGYNLWLEHSDYELDKDKKQQNIEYKVYSLDTCTFISHEENNTYRTFLK